MSDENIASLPLSNKVALVASSAGKSDRIVAGLARLGARTLSVPTIEIRALSNQAPLDRALRALSEYEWILFTSTHGVVHFLRRAQELGVPKPSGNRPRVGAVGPATRAALEEAGIPVALVGKVFVAEGVLAALSELHDQLQGLAGSRILLPRARAARDLIPRELEAAGARIDIVPCYENVLPEVDPIRLRQLRAETPDLMIFTSSSTVNNFITLLGDEEARRMMSRAVAAAIGPVTAQTLMAWGKEAEILPRENTIDSLLEAIALHFAR